MKKNLVMAAVVLMVSLLVAGIAIADDNILENDNTNNIDISTNADADATGGTGIGTGGASTVNFNSENRTPLPNLQYGTNFVNPGTVPKGEGWNLYYVAMYSYLSADKVERMRRHFQLSDIWNWKRRMHISVMAESQSEKPEGIAMMTYWPKTVANDGDEPITSITVRGDVNWPDEVFVGMAAEVCINDAHSDRFAIQALVNLKGVTDGSSISLGGAASTISNSGRRGGVVAAGGQLGTVEASLEEFKQFEVLCMNKGYVDYRGGGRVSVARPAPPPSAPKPPQVCDLNEIQKRIDIALRAIVDCTTWCFDNLTYRRDAAEGFIEKYACTGRQEYLRKAVYHFGIAEKNYRHPNAARSISANQAEADAIMAKAYKDWAVSVRILSGEKGLKKFIDEHNLDMNPDTLPKNFTP